MRKAIFLMIFSLGLAAKADYLLCEGWTSITEIKANPEKSQITIKVWSKEDSDAKIPGLFDRVIETRESVKEYLRGKEEIYVRFFNENFFLSLKQPQQLNAYSGLQRYTNEKVTCVYEPGDI